MMVKNNKGFSLVELAIALGLIAVLIGVVSAGSGMVARARVHREAQAVDNLRLAAQNYLSAANLTYAGVSVAALKSGGFLPASFDPEGANAFGGDYAVNANSTDVTRVDIAVAGVPEEAGLALSSAFQGKAEALAYDPEGKVWTGTF